MSSTITAQDFSKEELIEALEQRGFQVPRAGKPTTGSILRITYDKKHDIAYVHLQPRTKKASTADAHSATVSGPLGDYVTVDSQANFADSGGDQLLGVQVIGASWCLPAELLAAAEEEET
jgi:uncharacterized protein YuzE